VTAGQWLVAVAPDRCAGAGVCAGLAPEHFTVDGNRSRPPAAPVEPDEALLDAADCCPMEAIAVTDAATGKRIRGADLDGWS
jgi:ferredoxin